MKQKIDALVEKIKRKFFDWEDALFKRRHGLQLSAAIPGAELVTHNAESATHATPYHAVWCRNLRVLLAKADAKNRQYEYFVDIGAGKGKACIYAYDGYVLEKFLHNNRNAFRQHKSVLAYANDMQRDTLEKLGFSQGFRDAQTHLAAHIP